MAKKKVMPSAPNNRFTNIFSIILRTYTKYFFGPIVFTIIAITALLLPYSSTNGFDLSITFFCYITVISGLLLTVFVNNIFNDKDGFVNLFTITFISLLMSIINIFFLKSHSFLNNFALISSVISTFFFFAIFKEIIDKIQR